MNKVRLQHIGDLIDLGADTLGFRVGQFTVHINQNFIGLVQFFHHDVQIVHQDGEAAHNQQARHRDADGSKGHESVEEDSPDALFQQISNIIDLHTDNTHPFRR